MRSLAAGFVFAFSPAFAGVVLAADKAGPEAFNNHCRTCHSRKEGDNRLGPTLHGIVGRKAGSASGFSYSEAVKSSGVTWDEASLDKFLTNPNGFLPNNNMKPFSGIADAETRTQIIDFLKTNPD
ncbi:cytochrome c family protein [Hyphomicrobium sp.]|uniref:c-type cytochrome n=1 Tax=Hyphomicrobium sp. TaxID=82 RepID=UPI003566A968